MSSISRSVPGIQLMLNKYCWMDGELDALDVGPHGEEAVINDF